MERSYTGQYLRRVLGLEDGAKVGRKAKVTAGQRGGLVKNRCARQETWVKKGQKDLDKGDSGK